MCRFETGFMATRSFFTNAHNVCKCMYMYITVIDVCQRLPDSIPAHSAPCWRWRVVGRELWRSQSRTAAGKPCRPAQARTSGTRRPSPPRACHTSPHTDPSLQNTEHRTQVYNTRNIVVERYLSFTIAFWIPSKQPE